VAVADTRAIVRHPGRRHLHALAARPHGCRRGCSVLVVITATWLQPRLQRRCGLGYCEPTCRR
jgi:hypothetical protein